MPVGGKKGAECGLLAGGITGVENFGEYHLFVGDEGVSGLARFPPERLIVSNLPRAGHPHVPPSTP
ncbi:hypothetical protein [Acidithiobacillus sp.]|uniref:hypothetical protein n=1 Tax=Acidithiobacillus sp. TaxID=1872118 RepID=UPI002624C0A4|nr:hypothetical protein [Acidithiobacillus sp.]